MLSGYRPHRGNDLSAGIWFDLLSIAILFVMKKNIYIYIYEHYQIWTADTAMILVGGYYTT